MSSNESEVSGDPSGMGDGRNDLIRRAYMLGVRGVAGRAPEVKTVYVPMELDLGTGESGTKSCALLRVHSTAVNAHFLGYCGCPASKLT